MIQLHSTSGQLINWLLNQRAEAGLFPIAKGWDYEIQMQKFNNQLCYLLICSGEERKLNFVIIEDKGFFPFQGKAQQPKAEEWIVFCSARLGQEVYPSAVRANANLLVLSDGGVEFLHGEFASKRIEYRLLQQGKTKGPTPQPYGSIPSLHLEGEEALTWQQPLWQQVTSAILQGKREAEVAELLQTSLPLWQILPKAEKKTMLEATEKLIQELITRYFSGLLTIQRNKEKTMLIFHLSKEDKKSMAHWNRAIKLAMNWTKVEQPQLEFDSTSKA